MGRLATVGAALLWIGALVGVAVDPTLGGLLVLAALAGAVVSQARVAFGVVIVSVGVLSGAAAADRQAVTLGTEVPQGPAILAGNASTDAAPYGRGVRFVLQPNSFRVEGEAWRPWNGPRIAVVGDLPPVVAGDQVMAEGLLRSMPDLVRGDPVAGRLSAESIEVVASSSNAFMAAGNLFRSRVATQLERLDGGAAAALLAGFLIGDTSGLSKPDLESLRRAGLTHFVAVSGSNVALVLGAWWVVVAPLGAGTRWRAITGMLVLVVFVVATRWEASVVRAATMAALGLGGRVFGVPIDAWTALGGAVAILLTVSGDLAYDVGFQLSVLATSGVLAGVRIGASRSPRFLWSALAATVSAQAAVFPLLLLHFGTVPLMAPLANLVAAPLVTVATALGGIGVVVGWRLPMGAADLVAGAVLEVARVAGTWPQLGPLAAPVIIGVIAVTWRSRLRAVVLGALVVAGLTVSLPPAPPSTPTLTFLDVGQGDAILIRDPSGATALVDGGQDPAILMDGLRRYGVGRLDLVVATHGDADHVGGLADLEQSIDIGRFWHPQGQAISPLLRDIELAMEKRLVPVDEVAAGDRAQLGQFELRVLGPLRRYGAENDGSVVLWLASPGTTAMLPGDIGAVAQRELGPLRPDVLLVPHHGAATTDLDWLAENLRSVAVISVGPNSYGHPDSGVLDTIARSGVDLATTLADGDVSVLMP